MGLPENVWRIHRNSPAVVTTAQQQKMVDTNKINITELNNDDMKEELADNSVVAVRCDVTSQSSRFI
mgnify:CR=1 FL=1